MEFSAQNVAISAVLTADMSDREEAAQLSLLAGMLGPGNLGAVLVLATVAVEQDQGGGTTTPTPVPSGTGGTGGQLPPTIEGIDLPEVAGEIADDAEGLLQSRGLQTVLSQVESAEPIDRVVDTDPKVGTIVSRGSTVRIYISAGLRVPNVVNKSEDEAVNEIEEAGFAVGAVSDAQGTGRAQTVASQDPLAGTFAVAGSEVAISVYRRQSSGPRRISTGA